MYKRQELPKLETGAEFRPFANIGHGSGWRHDTGLSLNQQWTKNCSDGVVDRRIAKTMKKLKKGHKLQKDIFEANDMSDHKSVKQMSIKMKKRTDYLANQEEELV